MSRWNNTLIAERAERAKELFAQYQAVSAKLGPMETGVMLALGWISLETDDEPAEIDPEDYT